MIELWTVLAFGLCAMVKTIPHEPYTVVQIGQLKENKCEMFLTIADTQGQTTIPIDATMPPPMEGKNAHRYRVDVRQNDALVWVDDLPPVTVPKGRAV
jgi:hypothetical protein